MENPENQIIGAIKIKDALFIGDEFASQDLEFIVTNKVTHIINCASKEVANSWESIGVAYLSFPWAESDDQIIFDEKNDIVSEIFRFIEETSATGESCLVHSVRGQSRSCCVLAAYFMRKYRWSLYKTLEYLNSRRPDLEIRASFFHQLNNLETRLSKAGFGAKTSNWNETGETGGMEGEEIVIRNTFLNSKNLPFSEIYVNQNFYLNKDVKPKINWVDEMPRSMKNLVNFCGEKQEISMNKKGANQGFVRSILKGSNRSFSRDSKPSLSDNERKGPFVFGPYLKMNKSSKSLIEENALKPINTNIIDNKPAPVQAWSKLPPSSKDYLNKSPLQEQRKPMETLKEVPKSAVFSNMSRSSSLKVLNKDEGVSQNTEKPEGKSKYSDLLRNPNNPEAYIPNGNNVFHVTVNNFVTSPTINNTINKFSFGAAKPNSINVDLTGKDEKKSFIDTKAKERKQGAFRSSSKPPEEENKKTKMPCDSYFAYSRGAKPESMGNKDKVLNESNNCSNGSILFENKDGKKKVVSRREHDSISPLPIRGKSGTNPSPPKDQRDKKTKLMTESVYSQTSLKRFQSSLKEKAAYDSSYIKVLKDQRGFFNRFSDSENDVSPMRKVHDRSLISKNKASDSSLIEQNNVMGFTNSSQNKAPLTNIQSQNQKNPQYISRISNNIQTRKAISPLQNNTNVNNLIQSVTSYQISTRNTPSVLNVPPNPNTNQPTMNSSLKTGPIRATYERKELNSIVPSKQISISGNPNDSLLHFQEYKGKAHDSNNNQTSEFQISGRQESIPFRYYSPNSKLVGKTLQRSITPLAVSAEQQQMSNTQAKPRLRSSSPSTNNTTLSQNINNSSINSSFQSNNLFVYGYNSTAFQSKPKWKF